MSEPIRLFVGADGTNCDLESQAVLEWSVRKHTTAAVEIVWMQQAKRGPYAGWHCASGRTPFSHFRWSIPAMCGYEGRAIYTDSDFIFTADIAELFYQPMGGAVLLARKSSKPHGKVKTCCVLFDCAAAKGHIADLPALKLMADPQGHYSKYFQQHDDLVGRPEGDWNAIDAGGYASLDDPRIKAIHYSRMSTQPQLRHAAARLAREGRLHWYTGETAPHPVPALQALFDTLLAEAEAEGYGVERYRVDPFAGAERRNFTYATPVKGRVPA